MTEALAYGTGIERPFLCPVHGDSNPSASVNILKKKWICYACGAHGGLSGPALLMEPNYAKMASALEDQIEAADRVYPEAWLDRFDAGPVHPYWIERFGERAAREFRLGYDPDTDAVTYPLRDVGGEVLGVVRRALDPSEGPKYRYPGGVDVGRLLFGYRPDAVRGVVLVEGALDAVACWLVGVRAFAIYGARFSEAQARLVDRVDPDYVFTCFDNDDAGWSAHRMVEDAFPHRSVARLTWPRSWGKDIDEIGVARREKVFAGLLSEGLSCVECETCASPPSRTRSSPSTSQPRTLRIRRTSA